MVRIPGPLPVVNEAVIAVLSTPTIPYFPEFLIVSFTADHSTPQGALNTSWCMLLANAGTARAGSRTTITNRFTKRPPESELPAVLSQPELPFRMAAPV
jgi:hypothetical protein